MKKLIFSSIVALMFLASSCDNNKVDNSAKIDSLEQVISKKDADLEEFVGNFSDIQDGFALINEASGRVTNLSNGKGEKKNLKKDIQENMEFITNTMSENRKKIAELQAKLNSSTIKSNKLADQISKLQSKYEEALKQLEELKTALEDKDFEISSLNNIVSNLSLEKQEMQAANEEQAKVVENQDAQLNTAYYVFGTKSELKDHGILDGSKFKVTDKTDKSYFKKIDIRETKSIELNSKHAELLTDHPEGSYMLLKDGKGLYSLSINDPDKFWSISKYLVIRVK